MSQTTSTTNNITSDSYKDKKQNASKNNRQGTRRQVIEDRLITDDILGKIIDKVYASVDNPYDIGQQEIITVLLPLKLSNATIARVINTMIPDSKATQGSVASLIRFMNKKADMLDELLLKLDEV